MIDYLAVVNILLDLKAARRKNILFPVGKKGLKAKTSCFKISWNVFLRTYLHCFLREWKSFASLRLIMRKVLLHRFLFILSNLLYIRKIPIRILSHLSYPPDQLWCAATLLSLLFIIFSNKSQPKIARLLDLATFAIHAGKIRWDNWIVEKLHYCQLVFKSVIHSDKSQNKLIYFTFELHLEELEKHLSANSFRVLAFW